MIYLLCFKSKKKLLEINLKKLVAATVSPGHLFPDLSHEWVPRTARSGIVSATCRRVRPCSWWWSAPLVLLLPTTCCCRWDCFTSSAWKMGMMRQRTRKVSAHTNSISVTTARARDAGRRYALRMREPPWVPTSCDCVVASRSWSIGVLSSSPLIFVVVPCSTSGLCDR